MGAPGIHGTLADAKPYHDAMMGGVLVAGAIMAAPAIVPTAEFVGMAATGLVPGGTELIQFMAAMKWIRLTPLMTAGAGVATVVGIANAYRMREEIASYAKDKHQWIKTNLDRTFIPGLDFGTLSTAGEERVATPGHLKTRGSALGRSAPYARRRSSAPWCFTHKKRHWCDITRKR